MIPHIKKYFAIIVHYGDPDPTQRLVADLLASSHSLKRIVVVDHALQPLTLSQTARLQIIRPKQNSGYAGGINLGLGALLAANPHADDVVIMMNNDIKITTEIIYRVAAWWEKHPQPAIAGNKRGVLHLLSGRTSLSSDQPLGRGKVGYLHGAFLTAPFQVMMNMQGLPDSYFMYWEDVALSIRAARKHIPLQTIPDLLLSHDDQAKPYYSDNHLYYLVRNGALFLEQETSPLWRMFWLVKNRLRLVYHTLKSSRPVIRSALKDAVARKTGPRPAIR